MIVSFGDALTEDLFHGRRNARTRRVHPDLREAVEEGLDMIAAARTLDDLRSPPGNRLELLRGSLKGFHSIRVSSQWRLIFRWGAEGAYEVRLVDYH